MPTLRNTQQPTVDSWICNGPLNVESQPSHYMPHPVRTGNILKVIEMSLKTFPDTRTLEI